MDSIPLELAAMIMENLLEYDLVCDLSSEYSEHPRDATGCSCYDEDLTWIKLGINCRSSILNARTALRKLYDGSSKVFAKLLGDRTFRFTQVGTEDLDNIGHDARLVPYVTTLTIGCAGFCCTDISSTLI